jgi:predicted  nucleic acid-binding Zn-ribbon protein
MSFFKKISDYVPIIINPQPETDETTSPAPTQPQTSFGIADAPDLFERAPNNLYYLDPQEQSAAPIEPPSTREATVEASSLFSTYESNVAQLDNRLPQLQDRLDALRAKRNELTNQIVENKQKNLQMQETLASLRDAIFHNKPIPDSTITTLSSLGILGMLGGLPALPVIGALSGLIGFNEVEKQKARRIKNELERQMAESDVATQKVEEELDEVDNDCKKVEEQIVHEKLRLQRESQSFQMDRITNKESIINENPVWQDPFSDQNLIQNQNAPVTTPFNRLFQINDDEEKF